MAGPKVLLFDLGGVLVDSVGHTELQRLLSKEDPDEVRRRWEASPTLVRFQTGRCSADAFARSFLEEWRLDMQAPEFLERFASWVKPPSADTLALLAGLRRRHSLACLSNTNVVHWELILDGFGLREALDCHLASHELGLLKPTPEIYAQAVRELGCAPGDIAFFDDAPENVQGALGAGMAAHRIAGLDQLRPTLARLDLAQAVAS